MERTNLELPRTHHLGKVANEYRLRSYPVEKMNVLIDKTIEVFSVAESTFSSAHDAK